MTVYAGPIVDPHQHFWLFDEERYTSFRPDDPLFGVGAPGSALRRDFLPIDYEASAEGLNITATVHIEAGWSRLRDPVEETAWVEQLARAPRLARAYVGGAPFETERAPDQVARQAQFAGVVGIRQNLRLPELSRDAAQLRSAYWTAAVQELKAQGLLLELFMDLPHVPAVADLADRFPDLAIVVDHVINPAPRTIDGPDRWRAAMTTLSRRPNVSMKISSIRTHLMATGRPPADGAVSDIVDAVVGAFGVDRAMVASDYPLTELSGGLKETYDQLLRVTSSFSAQEQAALFDRTASRVYALDSDPRIVT